MNVRLLPVVLCLISLLAVSCKQGREAGDDPAEDSTRKPDDATIYHEQELAEGALWNEIEINNFIQEASGIDKMQIRAAEVVKKRSDHEAIAGYAESLKTDHSHSLENLKKIAAQQGLTLGDSIDADHQKKIQNLEVVDTDFERYFLEMMVEAHKKDIGRYENAMKKLPDDHELKPWVNDAIPMMQQHLFRAQRLLDDSSIFPVK